MFYTLDSSMSIEEVRLRALYSWVRSKDIFVKDVVPTSLMTNIFAGLSSQDCFEVSCDLICEIVYLASIAPRDMALIEHICNLLIPLNDTLSQSLDDSFKVKDLCRVFVEAGESFVDLIVSSPQHFEKIIDGILICSNYDLLDVVRITFNFWHKLTDQLLLNPEAMKNPIFFSLYDRLIGIIINHLRYPGEFDDFSAAERDEFREFRYISMAH
jgi:transportin-3